LGFGVYGVARVGGRERKGEEGRGRERKGEEGRGRGNVRVDTVRKGFRSGFRVQGLET
jgi:hypothetical protein